MAGKDTPRRSHSLLRHCYPLCTKFVPPVVFACIGLWFFCFLVNHSAPTTPQDAATNPSSAGQHRISSATAKSKPAAGIPTPEGKHDGECDLSAGRWIRDEHRRTAYEASCRDIFKGWNCLRNNKSNSVDLLAWRWQPWTCDLPQLDASLFLEHFRHQRIGFVGDSLNRNMYVSLVCSLRQVSTQVKKLRPVGADKAVTFLDYNVTVAYHRTNLLARYSRWEAKAEGEPLESQGYTKGFRVDVDVPQSTWAEAPHFHNVLILSTGHWWWAPDKFNPVSSPMLFFQNGELIVPTKSPEEGFDLVLKNMLEYVEKEMPAEGLKFLRTQSPRHFEGGDWNEGGICHRSKPLTVNEVDTFFAVENQGPNIEMNLVNRHLEKAVKGSSFKLLNISYMSSFRADAHPSSSGGKLHEDCMHWCLPGITDVWNDMLVLQLIQHKQEAQRTNNRRILL